MIWCLISFILLTAADQISKYIVNQSIALHAQIKVIDGFFYLTNTRNTGAAWSMLPGGRIFFIGMAAIVIIAVFVYIYRLKDRKNLLTVSLVLVASGAFGNMIDRILYGYVVDFLDFYIFGYDFPVFNFADCCLTIGVALIILDTLFGKEQENGTA